MTTHTLSKRNAFQVEGPTPSEPHSTQHAAPRQLYLPKSGSVPKESEMTQTVKEKNKAFVLEAFETLFN